MNLLSNTLINTKNVYGLNVYNSNGILNKETKYNNMEDEEEEEEEDEQEKKVDMNIDNYSIKDLFMIFNLVDNSSLFQIKDVANNLIARMKSQGKTDMAIFFENAKNKLIDDYEREYDSETETETESESETESDPDNETNFFLSNSSSSSSSLIGGDKWWEGENPIKSQHSRHAPLINNKNNNTLNSNDMLKYEKSILLDRLKLTENKLIEMKKENRKLKKSFVK